jgi:hypothetical protein
MKATDENKLKALKWFKTLSDIERFALSIKNINKISNLTADEIVIIWRRKD